MCDVICNTFQFPVMFQMYQIAYARNSDIALNSNLSMVSMRIAGSYKKTRLNMLFIPTLPAKAEFTAIL